VTIGVFDSGIGGLSVYAGLAGRGVTYIADQGFGMYGERSLEEVRQRSEQLTTALLDNGATTIVVACNSASAAALQHLRGLRPDVRFVGMEPAVKPAAALTASGTIGVLATQATFQGELFASLVERFGSGHRVVATACPGLAAAIENDSDDVDSLLDDYVGKTLAGGADVIVLGCTHYSLVADRIAVRAGPATILDPAAAVARRAIGVAGQSAGPDRFFTTGEPGVFSAQLDRYGFGTDAVGSLAV
jgi:glutamate racemase